MMRFDLWDEAIALRLQSVRMAITPIPVSALPKEAGKFGIEQFESIDWLFPSYTAAPPNRNDGLQEVDFMLVVRLQLQERYGGIDEKAAIEWAESQILMLLTGYKLPETTKAIALESGKLFAPTQGQWYKEISFKFSASVLGISQNVLPVENIGADNNSRKLMEVS